MKKLGLIGGVGPQSTIPYYKGIVFGVQKKVGKPFFPNMVIESLSTFDVLRMSGAGDTKGLEAYFLKGIRNLAAAGADFGALACNTGHMVFHELQAGSPIPLISIVDVACQEAVKRNYHKVGLLGTAATMREDFFKEPFRREGIDVAVPDQEEQGWIAGRIENELEYGIVKEETVTHFLEISEELFKNQKIDAVVLGCTELPLVFKDHEGEIPLLDTMELHIAALVDAIVSS